MISKSIVNIYIYILIRSHDFVRYNLINITLEQKWVKQEVEKKKEK